MNVRRCFFVSVIAAALAFLPAASRSSDAPAKENPDYWYERGALASTYGADRHAVRYFEKVVALDPNRSDAWFQMGVSYGEIRWFDKALEAIDRAIGLRPGFGLYYYGRGRIYLMVGAENEAMNDFAQAAALNNEEARRYLLKQ